MRIKVAVILLLVAVPTILAASVYQNNHFVISALKSVKDKAVPLLRYRRSNHARPVMSRFHVTSTVTSRYSRVAITSVVENIDVVAKEISVEMRLPKTAFISNFSMEIEGVTYVGIVKDKTAATAQYQAAIARGESAGLVSAKVREVQTFNVAVNIAAGSDVTFKLDYQELLKRKLGEYHHVIYADPGQVVDDFKIEVLISEASGITSVNARSPSPDKNRRIVDSDSFDTGNVDIRRSHTQAHISYRPTIEQQREIRRRSDLSFVVNYDVTREELGGEILIKDGYFVHFFAPNNLPIFPKKIVFVIDKSGSMRGRKMDQTKSALLTILDDLSEADQFNIITFSSSVHTMQSDEMMDVNPTNIENAKSHVRSIHARGGTNFHDAAMRGVALLDSVTSSRRNTLQEAGMIILLTDGRPTVGITNNERILQDVRNEVNGRYSIFCLGFGQDLDHTFLDQLASENKGLSRKIYNDADAALQLRGFYHEVASPMLAHVIMRYSGTPLDRLTKSTFDNYFDGSELLVAGRLQNYQAGTRNQNLEGRIAAGSATGHVSIVARGRPFEETFADDSFDMEKIWAYLTIKEMLQNKSRLSSDETTMQESIRTEVLRLSLLYNFVTPLTSMVVTKPGKDVLASTVPPIPIPRPYPRLPMLQASVPAMNFQMHLPGTSSRGRTLGSSLLFNNHAVYNMRTPMQFPNPGGRTLMRLSGPRYTTTTTTTTVATTTTATTQATTTTREIPARPIPTDPSSQTYSCGNNILLESLVNVTSPRYPGLYPSNIRCLWMITLPSTSSSGISMEIEQLDMELSSNCARDRILVYPDLNVSSQREPLQICGYNSTRTSLHARSNFAVVFESDDVVEGRGFRATFQPLY